MSIGRGGAKGETGVRGGGPGYQETKQVSCCPVFMRVPRMLHMHLTEVNQSVAHLPLKPRLTPP